MASSRIFVKGLPPSFTDADFKKHFGHGRDLTDAKIFPSRRIGYVGYKTPEDALKAVKYFNKSFIRMSRIAVEVARPVDEVKSAKPAAVRASTSNRDTDPRENQLKRKRDGDSKEQSEEDPKLKEFLDTYKAKNKKNAWDGDDVSVAVPAAPVADGATVEDAASDDEYEQIPKKARTKSTSEPPTAAVEANPVVKEVETSAGDEDEEMTDLPHDSNAALTDSDWLRSRTKRNLDLLGDDEEFASIGAVEDLSRQDRETAPAVIAEVERPAEAVSSIPTPPAEEQEEPVDQDIETVRSTMRLYLRNLPYNVSHEDLEAEFARFDNLESVHIPLDKKTGTIKGFAFVQYTSPDSAEKAFVDRDGQIFQGRLLHIIPATARKDNKLDDFELAKLPLKKQQEIKRKREAANTTFNWNALYMNADAVISSVASRLGLSKSEVLDPTSSDAAVKQAHAETHIIQETKSYFQQHGVDLDAFKKSQRGDTAILVKNIPADCSRDELKRLFEEQGDIKKFLMPPAGTIAIVEYTNAAQCKAAFGSLAYRRVKSSMLFLEKAPKDLFTLKPISENVAQEFGGVSKVSTTDLKDSDQTVADTAGTATLFVRNLNFSTTTKLLTETFQPLEGFMSARVKTRTDPKKPRQVLSMGFGFVEFKTAKQAQAALHVMDGYSLENHKLQVRASHKGADAAEEQRKADAAKKAAGQKTKIIIKNLPFEANKKDVRSLFGAYGQLRSVRMPKKMDRGARGFAFADFTTVREAQSAMDALRDTHLLGRRLVLDFAAEDAVDAEEEIEKMQQKVGAQANKVALQKLTSGGRKKFNGQANEDEG